MTRPGEEPISRRDEAESLSPMILPASIVFVEAGSTYTHERGWITAGGDPTEPRHDHPWRKTYE